MSSKVDFSIIGKQFGRLTVVAFSHTKNKNSYWECHCECGNQKIIQRSNLKSGDIISCGCYREENKHKFGYKHGFSNDKIYTIWSAMVQRVTNPNNDRYNCYGGRGIIINNEWMIPENFIEWAIKNGYKEGFTIERIDVNGNYEPNNCKWITMKEQYDNRQNTRLITYEGKTQTRAKWARELGSNAEKLRYRIDIAKWSVERAFKDALNFRKLYPEALPLAQELTISEKI